MCFYFSTYLVNSYGKIAHGHFHYTLLSALADNFIYVILFVNEALGVGRHSVVLERGSEQNVINTE